MPTGRSAKRGRSSSSRIFLPLNPYLIVEAREEPPVHGEHLADVARRRDVPHVAQVDVRVVARHAAEVLHEGVVGLQVVVEPEHPAGVQLGNELQVVDDALEVLALLRQLRVRVSVKRETYRLNEAQNGEAFRRYVGAHRNFTFC